MTSIQRYFYTFKVTGYFELKTTIYLPKLDSLENTSVFPTFSEFIIIDISADTCHDFFHNGFSKYLVLFSKTVISW